MIWTRTPDPHAAAVAHIRPLLPGLQGTFAVPGGSTPGPVLRALRGDLDGVVLTLVDERHAGPEHSNTRALAEAVGPAALHRWDLGGELETARAQLEGSLPPTGLVLLGMGPDGHIASLFPGRAWGTPGQRVLCIEDSPKPPPARLSMTLEELDTAAHIVAVVKGAGKAEAVRRAHALDPLLPTTHLRTPIHWFVDPEAGAHLPETP